MNSNKYIKVDGLLSDPDVLFENNRPYLKKIFSFHNLSKEGRISFAEFSKFCKNSRIFPVRNI